LDREKIIYNYLGRHPAILYCLEISNTRLKFPYIKNGNLQTFLRNNVPKPPYFRSQ
ncbi:hypothetical protein K432DRAFT_302572, partial [Lepidopterella palustris CBS 459.81]